MKHKSAYLEWYVHTKNVKYDLRSSGITHLKHNLTLADIDLSVNYAAGNPETSKIVAKRYGVQPQNIFLSTEGASGQNARIIRYIAEKCPRKKEAIVEYPTYEPLLRQVQEHFPLVKRLQRKESEAYKIDINSLRKIVSEKTALLVLTNPHAPSGTITSTNELQEIMEIASQNSFYVLCDEIYAEFDRKTVPTIFSINKELGITTTSFTKAYGLGGLRLGIALTSDALASELYNDVLNTVGNSPNIVQIIITELLKNEGKLEEHKRKWIKLKRITEEWLEEMEFEYLPNRLGVTYWVKMPLKDTYKWMNEHTIPKHKTAAVPGTFFLFKNDYDLVESNWMRLGIGNINPDAPDISEALKALETAINTSRKH